jgi:hypothetical protein
MARLQIKEIANPIEFVQSIIIDQNEYLYVYTDNMFKPIDNIYDKLIDLYEEYLPAIMFTDVKTIQDGLESRQYFQDIVHGQERRVIYSGLAIRHINLNLTIFPEIEHHSFSLLHQLIHKGVLPWHVPQIGFEFKLDHAKLTQLSSETQWVMQHVTS